MARYHVPPPPRTPSSPLLRLLPLGYFTPAPTTVLGSSVGAPSQDLSHPVLVRMRQLLLTHAGVRGNVDVRDVFGRTALFVAVRGWMDAYAGCFVGVGGPRQTI